MNFQYSEVQRMLADSLARYLADQYDMETRHAIARSGAGRSDKHWRMFGELGVIGMLFDERHGGYGGTGFDIAVIFEELGRALVLEPLLASAVLAGSAVARADGEHPLLASIINGSHVATLALEEPDTRWQIERTATCAKRDGDGWVVDGLKIAVLSGGNVDTFLVLTRTAGKVGEQGGLSLFLVPANTKGIVVREYTTVDGTHCADLRLEGVRLARDALVGGEGNGYGIAEYSVARGTLALCAEALGSMEVLKTDTIEYLKTRKQFGQAIGSFQALQHRIVELLIEIEQARSAVINAAAAMEGDRLTRERAVSAAKHSIGVIGRLVAEECIQMHGGIGMTWELRMPHHAKRLVMIDHLLGDEDHHLERFAALGRVTETANVA